MGMWGLYLHNMLLVEEGGEYRAGACQISNVSWPWLKLQFVYSKRLQSTFRSLLKLALALLYDFLLLALAVVALVRLPGRTNLRKMLFVDGMSYFLGA